eukprot:9494403-Pyramimonas_sp.AAC.1
MASKRGPREPQDGPESVQWGPKSAPRLPEERPQRDPEAINVSSRGPHVGPKRPTTWHPGDKRNGAARPEAK